MLDRIRLSRYPLAIVAIEITSEGHKRVLDGQDDCKVKKTAKDAKRKKPPRTPRAPRNEVKKQPAFNASFFSFLAIQKSTLQSS